MEVEQSELWSRATEYVEKLVKFQKNIVTMLPESRSHLPVNYEDLKEANAQTFFLNHIRLRSLYAFADNLWLTLEEQCKNLANCSSVDASKELETKAILEKSLSAISCFPLSANIGLMMFTEAKETIREHMDFIVYSEEGKSWSFRDIMGNIDHYGLLYKELWKVVSMSKDPLDVKIKDLLDDNTLVRVY